MSSLYDTAYEIAKKAHGFQKDKAGVDYMQHLLFVASLVDSETEKAVALLHDIVEDTNMSLKDLRDVGIPEEVVTAVGVLTKKRGEPYFKYIDTVKENKLACKVKLADLTHNADLSRIPNPTARDYERREKYLKAIEILKS